MRGPLLLNLDLEPLEQRLDMELNPHTPGGSVFSSATDETTRSTSLLMAFNLDPEGTPLK